MAANSISIVPKTAWTHRKRFSATSTNDDFRYFESGNDTADSMAKWDFRDDSPISMSSGNLAGFYIVPIKCYLASYEAIGMSYSADDRPFQIEVYYGTPTLDSGSNTTMALAAVSNGVTSHDIRREPERLYEDWGKTITLDQGDIVIPTIKSNYDGTNGIQGSIVIFFREF